ncbi:hypothetical protein LguiA_014320 [Lonicera macranthoides]
MGKKGKEIEFHIWVGLSIMQRIWTSVDFSLFTTKNFIIAILLRRDFLESITSLERILVRPTIETEFIFILICKTSSATLQL